MIRSRDLEDRAIHGVEPATDRPGPGLAARTLATLQARIALARALRPPTGRELHCGHCWGSGREAVLRALDGDGAGDGR